MGAPLWVQMGQPDELAEAELRYRGPLTRGSGGGVFFGVQLKVISWHDSSPVSDVFTSIAAERLLKLTKFPSTFCTVLLVTK